MAAGSVIGQVLECVALLSDDAGVQALSITTTAFLEAWMEHILREKIKFRFVLIQHTPRDLIEPIRNCQKGEQWGGGSTVLCRIHFLRQVVGSDCRCISGS